MRISNTLGENQSTFARRLSILVKRGGGVRRLAQDAGLSASTLSRCLKEDYNPSVASAIAIAKASAVSLDWLCTGEGSMDSTNQDSEIAVPFYEQCASAGPGLLANDDQTRKHISLPMTLIGRQTGLIPSDLCALLADGDSMETTIRNGALLLVDRTSRQPGEGIFIVSRGDEVLVKRVQRRGPRCLRLISDNTRYEAEEVPLDDVSVPVQIFGRVIWIGQPL